MKKSQILRQNAAMQENDLKAIGIYKKALREERYERFEERMKEIKTKGYELINDKEKGRVTFNNTNYGIIDYYPKSNSLLIRKKNKWIKPGLKWLIKNVLY